MGDGVKVGCLIPNGVHLRISDWVKDPDGNSFPKEVATYEIAGPRQHLGRLEGGLHGEGGAVFTEIPADHFDKWLEQNKDSDLVKSGAVFKASDEDVKKVEEAEEAEREEEEKHAEAVREEDQRVAEAEKKAAAGEADEPDQDTGKPEKKEELRGEPVKQGDSPVKRDDDAPKPVPTAESASQHKAPPAPQTT